MKMEIIKKLYLPGTIKKLKRKETFLGLDVNYDIYNFLNKRLIACIIIFLLGLIFFPYNYILAPAITIIYYYLVEYICFDIPIKKRKQKIEEESLYFFETVLLVLENGSSLKEALDKACLNNNGDLAQEFQKSLNEVNLGKDLNKSLKDLQKRIPSYIIQNIILNIINTNKFGNNITESVENQLDYIRKERRLENQKYLLKLPVYVKLVSFLFIFITLILIIILPMFFSMIK